MRFTVREVIVPAGYVALSTERTLYLNVRTTQAGYLDAVQRSERHEQFRSRLPTRLGPDPGSVAPGGEDHGSQGTCLYIGLNFLLEPDVAGD